MIRTPMLHALTLLLLGGGVLTSLPVHAQPYPPSPSFEAVVKDAQKDGILDTLKGLGVPESHLKSVKFEKINAQDRRNFKTDVSYYKENARKFDDRMISWIIAVVPKAALGASFRVPVAVHYTRYVEANDNWTLLNKWQFHSTVHGLDVMVAPPDLGMPTNAEKVAAIDTFFASRPDLSAHRLMTRDILSILKTGIYTPHAEQGVHEARDLVTFVWQLAARVELAKERSEEGVTESTFDNVLFKFLVNRSPDGRFTVTQLDTIAECSAADAEAACPVHRGARFPRAPQANGSAVRGGPEGVPLPGRLGGEGPGRLGSAGERVQGGRGVPAADGQGDGARHRGAVGRCAVHLHGGPGRLLHRGVGAPPRKR